MNVSYYCRLVLNDPGVPGEPNEMEMRKTEEKIPSPPLKKADDGESEGKKLSAFFIASYSVYQGRFLLRYHHFIINLPVNFNFLHPHHHRTVIQSGAIKTNAK